LYIDANLFLDRRKIVMIKKIVGKHVLADLHGCNSELLKKVEYVADSMFEAARISNATIVGKFFKQFDPWGVSGVIVIAESHISIHTWPEHGLASVDYFSCSEEPNIKAAIDYLAEAFEAQNVETIEASRGDLRVKKIRNIPVHTEPLNEMVI